MSETGSPPCTLTAFCVSCPLPHRSSLPYRRWGLAEICPVGALLDESLVQALGLFTHLFAPYPSGALESL